MQEKRSSPVDSGVHLNRMTLVAGARLRSNMSKKVLKPFPGKKKKRLIYIWCIKTKYLVHQNTLESFT